MELDFKSVRALSSPTRVRILRKLMEGKSTTTKLSEELDKSKSTISSHLKELTEAGLLEKDEKEGRRRVEYRATRKAEAIVKGKERKVKFSIASSAFTALGGALLVWKDLAGSKTEKALQAYKGATSGDSGGSMGTMGTMEAGNLTNGTAEAGRQAAEASGAGVEQLFLFAGIGLLTVSATALVYGLTINYLSPDEEDENVKVEVR